MAWPIIAAMAIQAGSSIASGLLGSMSASAQRKAIRKAAARSYNSMMNNSREMERTLMENMTDYEKDAADYKSSMIAARSAMGGVRTVNEHPEQSDVLDYEFDIDKIDYEKEGYEEVKNEGGNYFQEKLKDNDNYQGGGKTGYSKSTMEYLQNKADVEVDKRNTDALKSALDNYTGRTPEFNHPSTSAIAVEQESIRNLQTDLNRTYRQGMQQVYLQREQAYNNYQDMKAQADLYGLQSTLSMFSGLIGAGSAVGQGMIQLYSQGSYKNNAQGATAYTSPFAASSSASRYGGHYNY